MTLPLFLLPNGDKMNDALQRCWNSEPLGNAELAGLIVCDSRQRMSPGDAGVGKERDPWLLLPEPPPYLHKNGGGWKGRLVYLQ